MNKMAKISINLPVYNGGGKMKRKLDSLAEQTFGDFQVIITDNNSSDETEDICRSYAAQDKRFLYFRNPGNYGIDFSFRAALFRSLSCQYTVYTSHSDLWEPTFLEECVVALDNNPAAVLSYPYCDFVDEAGNLVFAYKDNFTVNDTDPAIRYLNVIANMGFCNAYYGMIRSDCFAGLEGYYYFSGAGNDNLFLAAMALEGHFIQLPKPLLKRFKPHEDTGLEGRESRLLKMGCGDRCPEEYLCGLYMPFHSHVTGHLSVILNSGLPLDMQENLMAKTIEVFLARYGHCLQHELDRTLENITKGHVWFGYFPSMLGIQETCPHMFFHYAQQVSMHLDSYAFLLNKKANYNYLRALLYCFLKRLPEALAALKKELEINPLSRNACELKAALNQRGIV